MTNESRFIVRIKMSIIALTVLALAACGSNAGKEATVPDDQAVQPSAGQSDWETTSVLGVDITVPADLEKTGPISPGDDAQMFTFQTPKNSFGTRGGVQVVTLPKRKKTAEELADTIINQAKATTGATKTSKVKVVWPGAEDAWFITYVAQVPQGGKQAPHPAEVLVADLPNGGQTQATVTTIEEDFAPQKMHEILQTLTITGSAGATKS